MCYHPLKIIFLILELQILLSCDQLTYFSSQISHVKFYLTNDYEHNFPNYMSLQLLNGTFHLKPM